MDVKLWKLERPVDVLPGKPMIIDQRVVLKFPPISGDKAPHGVILSGGDVGTVVRLSSEPVLWFPDEVEFVASADAIIGSKITDNLDRPGALMLGPAGLYVFSHLPTLDGSFLYGLNHQGEVLFGEDFRNVRQASIHRWHLAIREGEQRRLVVEVEAQPPA